MNEVLATVIGVLEPSVPYPADTEIIANMVTSPHHMGAMMITMRVHRMTQLFGRLKPGVTMEAARAELQAGPLKVLMVEFDACGRFVAASRPDRVVPLGRIARELLQATAR